MRVDSHVIAQELREGAQRSTTTADMKALLMGCSQTSSHLSVAGS